MIELIEITRIDKLRVYGCESFKELNNFRKLFNCKGIPYFNQVYECYVVYLR